MTNHLSSKRKWIVFSLLIFGLIFMVSSINSKPPQQNTSSDEKAKNSLQKPFVPQEAIVRLNIGGKRFYTTSQTVTRYAQNERSFFKVLLRTKNVLDEEGFIFVDRNGELFEPILDYLRTGIWDCPENIKPERLLQEAEFYGISLPQAYSDAAFKELRTQIEEEQIESILAQNKTEAETLKQFIFNSFTESIKSNNKSESSLWNGRIATPWVFPSKDAMKLLTENYPTFVSAHKWWYNEACYKTLLNNEFADALVTQLQTTYKLSVIYERWYIVQRPTWQRTGSGDIFATQYLPNSGEETLFSIVHFLGSF